ncbi:MAG: 50S ribosomal protein L28 [Planctomycetales bacterium]|nr:50S ribosomal protein L28 [Planctomycetales bacterium]
MARECQYCGKKTRSGMMYTRRGLAKRKGGVGRRITGHNKRTFEPNVQKIRAVVGGRVVRVKICTQCLRTGLAQKPAPGRGKKPAS